ncbi:zinc finger-like domain-containing protein [uncultured Shewanella sp.]|uniref:zinc finger-like domain-containing protein n=1 Tax=Shewanella atlantica TaxID=271099 RepID=UPI00260F63C4|nr:zinc finger-like domain-containing protein [uncultured Shewanella sp.]
MNKLEHFQSFVRKNGKKLTGVDVPVVLSDEQSKSPQLSFTFGWRIEIGVGAHSHGAYNPSGVNCGSRSQANSAAHDAAKEYVSGRDSLFNARFKKMLDDDIRQKFLLRSQDLGSAPDRYVGSETCDTCYGSGQNTCHSCSGRGKTDCNSCYGRGRKEVSKYDSYTQRTVYTTESCSSCWGSGDQTCSSCSGSGYRICSTCKGGGYLYYSYTIDGDATRATRWQFDSNDYHSWTQDFVKNEGLNIINEVENVTEQDVKGDLEGCTFVYAFSATLQTLQYTATLDKVNTHLCFAGKHNQTHDGGGVYDPAVWSVAKRLGAGNKDDDTQALATPAINSIIVSQTNNSASALLKENWVSSEIKNAVMTNYDTLVTQLKKKSVKGIVPKMLAALMKFGFLFFMLSLLIALAFPQFAEMTDERMGLMRYPHFFWALLTLEFGLFGLPALANYPMLLGLHYLCYQGVKRLSWRRLNNKLYMLIALLATFLLPHVLFSLYFNVQHLLQSSTALGHALVGGSVFLCFYLLPWGFAKPKKWYLKPLGLIAAAAVYLGLQIVMMTLDQSMGILPEAKNYIEGLGHVLNPAMQFIGANILEIALLSLLFSYSLTRRSFWLKSKTAVADYNSAVLMKSMKMD